MFTLRYTSIAVMTLSLCSANSLADDEITSSQTSPRKNILITKGFSAPNATTQNYSGENIVSIVPSDSDINKTLDQLIAENTPGFVHTNSGTAKHNASNYHRGLSDKYTLYLLNGVPFPTSTLGSQNIPAIPMESIALIEVIRGAQASLYGSSSLTGVINIITKTGEMADAQLNISAGSNNTQRVGGAYANNWNNLNFDPAAKDIPNRNIWGELTQGTHKQTKTRDVAAYAKEHGYDGVIFKQIADKGGNMGYDTLSPETEGYNLYADTHIGEDSFDATSIYKSDIFIAFNSNQIKSATDNIGGFSTQNDDIRYR